MALDFQQVREQVKQMGENAPLRAKDLQSKREQAMQLLRDYAQEFERLHQRVQLVVHNYDPNLRCARPAWPPLAGELEPLDGCYPLPSLPAQATILAADGSQIPPDRHAAVNYCLINVGAIQMRLGLPTPPEVTILSQLLYDEQLDMQASVMTDARLALMRDLNERKRLADLAEQATAPVITFTDGPMELWGGKEGEGAADFRDSLEAYLDVLKHLHTLKVATAGYVDKPAATLVLRLLEVAAQPENELAEIKDRHPLHGVLDKDLYRSLLGPGERSAVFAIQSRSARSYQNALALHFFYLNVGREKHPWLARVEVPAWVATQREMLDNLHATLVHQCRIMGNRPYPYLLHRAHEAAVVSLQEKEQVNQMIALEMHNRGVEIDQVSYKQSAKDLPGRTSYER